MTRTEDDLSHDGAFSDVSTISTSPVAQEDNGKYTPNKDQSLIKWAVLINRFLYSTTVQNFTHLSYSFRVTKPIIGAGRWHGPKINPLKTKQIRNLSFNYYRKFQFYVIAKGIL